MLMQKRSTRLLKESIVILDLMSGEEKSFYLEKMWELYIKLYEKSRRNNKSRAFELDKINAYDLCSKLTKIFGH